MTDFKYEKLFQYSKDTTEYIKLESNPIKSYDVNGKKIINVTKDILENLAKEAFYQISHFLRADHLKQMSAIFEDLDASDNDKYVALTLLKNANVAAGGILPMCQDTGTAIVVGKKGSSFGQILMMKNIFEGYMACYLRKIIKILVN